MALDPYVRKLHPGNRFRLMYGLPLLPQENMPEDPKKPKNVPQAMTLQRVGTYQGPIDGDLQGAKAVVRTSHLQPVVVIARFENPKLKVDDKEIGPNWHPLLESDFKFDE